MRRNWRGFQRNFNISRGAEGEYKKMKKEVYLSQEQREQQRKVIQKLKAAKTKQPITSLPFKQIAFKAYDSREKKENYYYIEFENRRRWEGHLFHEQEILRKSDQLYFATILGAIKQFEANFCEKQNHITCKNIRRCLRIHLHRVEHLKIPSYDQIYKELGLCIWVTSGGRKRAKEVGTESLGDSTSFEEKESSEEGNSNDTEQAGLFANLGRMKDLVFKEPQMVVENRLEKRSPVEEMDQYMKKMDQDFEKLEKMMLYNSQKQIQPIKEEKDWEIQVRGVYRTQRSEKVKVIQASSGKQSLEEWNENAEPRLNRAMLDFLLEKSRVPSLDTTISF